MSNPSKIVQTTPQTTTADGQTSTVTTDGAIVQSADPSTRPDAPLGEKLAGDFKGAVSGTLGSLEAAAGAVLGNKQLQEKGLDKMQDEDERLGSKRGVMPVGSGRREHEVDASRGA